MITKHLSLPPPLPPPPFLSTNTTFSFSSSPSHTLLFTFPPAHLKDNRRDGSTQAPGRPHILLDSRIPPGRTSLGKLWSVANDVVRCLSSTPSCGVAAEKRGHKRQSLRLRLARLDLDFDLPQVSDAIDNQPQLDRESPPSELKSTLTLKSRAYCLAHNPHVCPHTSAMAMACPRSQARTGYQGAEI